jgi:deoxyadenosine/deoxycytidine kinase
MERGYIQALNRAYEDFFAEQKVPVLTIDTTPLDFVTRREHLDLVVNRIRQALGIPPFQPSLPLPGGAPG